MIGFNLEQNLEVTKLNCENFEVSKLNCENFVT